MKNEHSDLFNIIKLLKQAIFGFIVLEVLTIGGFLIYINNGYNDEDRYSSIDAKGVYNLVDSDGNVLATDLTVDDISKILGSLDGKDKSN